jgi:hypothetical protein
VSEVLESVGPELRTGNDDEVQSADDIDDYAAGRP